MKNKILVVGTGEHEITSLIVARFKEKFPEIHIVLVNEHLGNPFEREPMIITALPLMPESTLLRDKKVKLLHPNKSKYNKQLKNKAITKPHLQNYIRQIKR